MNDGRESSAHRWVGRAVLIRTTAAGFVFGECVEWQPCGITVKQAVFVPWTAVMSVTESLVRDEDDLRAEAACKKLLGGP